MFCATLSTALHLLGCVTPLEHPGMSSRCHRSDEWPQWLCPHAMVWVTGMGVPREPNPQPEGQGLGADTGGRIQHQDRPNAVMEAALLVLNAQTSAGSDFHRCHFPSRRSQASISSARIPLLQARAGPESLAEGLPSITAIPQ